MLTPTRMPWTDFAALWARIKAGQFLWPGASTWILIVLSVLAIVGAGILSALFGSTKTRDDGLPRYKDLRMGKKAALAKARQSLELPAEATEDEMIVALCKLDGQTLYVQHEDSMWVFAPQRSGKTLFLAVGIVLDAPVHTCLTCRGEQQAGGGAEPAGAAGDGGDVLPGECVYLFGGALQGSGEDEHRVERGHFRVHGDGFWPRGRGAHQGYGLDGGVGHKGLSDAGGGAVDKLEDAGVQPDVLDGRHDGLAD